MAGYQGANPPPSFIRILLFKLTPRDTLNEYSKQLHHLLLIDLIDALLSRRKLGL
jgi:hypothetical protein